MRKVGSDTTLSESDIKMGKSWKKYQTNLHEICFIMPHNFKIMQMETSNGSFQHSKKLFIWMYIRKEEQLRGFGSEPDDSPANFCG